MDYLAPCKPSAQKTAYFSIYAFRNLPVESIIPGGGVSCATQAKVRYVH
jgi:hypothetical protein